MRDIGLRIRDAEYDADRFQQRANVDATTLGDVMAALRRQYIPLMLCALFGLVAGIAHHVTTPEQYYASATVLVDERRSELDEEISASIPFARNDTSLLNEIQVLQSLQLATEVARRIELQERDVFLNPPSSLAGTILSNVKTQIGAVLGGDEDVAEQPTLTPQEQQAAQLSSAASRLQGDIRIERLGLSFSIEVSYVGHDAALAALIVNTYADAYLEDGLTANVESTERTAEWMRTRLQELEESSAQVQSQATALRQSDPSQVMRLRELAQRATTLDALYQTISARYEQISIQGSFPVSNGRILTQSIVPKTAALPKMWQTLAVTTLLGLMAGFSLAVWREARERSFRVSTEVYNHTGCSFLGHLPHIDTRALNDASPPKTTEIKLNGLSFAPALDKDAGHTDPDQTARERRKVIERSPELFWSVLMPQTVFSETLRNIHATVDLRNTDGASRVVAVTSMLPGEGKTTLAVNYANMLAKTGARTVLIDMDWQGSRLRGDLNIPAGPGIVEVLHGNAPLSEAIQVLEYTGLSILPSGAIPQQSFAGDLVYQQNMQALVAELRKHYDHVILDMPPLAKVSDAKAIIAQLDNIILICEWGQTPRSLVTQYLAHEPEISQKIVGIALNKVNIRKLHKYARPGWPESYL
ncbi:polysaccharide biosynthesis tyrosine autokinase [Octadecabacter sp. G9-8]|uniref:non-specific protein-tyrosine kinase n=1 Tax=Octadecabacter dasysiphoniae TaxID=2909341 RepID=A0ABS9CVJ2_9RHOB|nr:polysaccharide biosynthesis tyrosine autokinase [Octadecabacter dasysiphoniae]MCF2870420.1 polysaccharide biosynthesis tyrosine autokinase [Octadecabacter dasysiphoniae]